MNALEALLKGLGFGREATHSWRRPPLDPRAQSAPPQPTLSNQMMGTASPPPPAQSLAQGLTGSSQMDNFRFEMGKKDYQFVRPQLKKLFGAKGKDSPLNEYVDLFIEAGERYGVDPRVLVSIANNESSLGKRYPKESFNPFGYLVDVPATAPGTTGVPKEQAIWQGLRNAGFTSLPHAIDRLTGRFQRQPTENYQKFYQDPSFSNLQMAYNANPAERGGQLANFEDLLQYYQQ